MIHYSCDRCRRNLKPQEAIRYVIKMEIEATLEPSADQVDSDCDCLLEMDQTLERLEEEILEEEETHLFQRKRFDLCPECYRKFIKNPIGRDATIPFGFSHN